MAQSGQYLPHPCTRALYPCRRSARVGSSSNPPPGSRPRCPTDLEQRVSWCELAVGLVNLFAARPPTPPTSLQLSLPPTLPASHVSSTLFAIFPLPFPILDRPSAIALGSPGIDNLLYRSHPSNVILNRSADPVTRACDHPTRTHPRRAKRLTSLASPLPPQLSVINLAPPGGGQKQP